MDREKLVRETAYAIWEAEGRPEGREADHWREAEERVAKGEVKRGGQKTPAAAVKKQPSEKPAVSKSRSRKTL